MVRWWLMVAISALITAPNVVAENPDGDSESGESNEIGGICTYSYRGQVHDSPVAVVFGGPDGGDVGAFVGPERDQTGYYGDEHYVSLQCTIVFILDHVEDVACPDPDEYCPLST